MLELAAPSHDQLICERRFHAVREVVSNLRYQIDVLKLDLRNQTERVCELCPGAECAEWGATRAFWLELLADRSTLAFVDLDRGFQFAYAISCLLVMSAFPEISTVQQQPNS